MNTLTKRGMSAQAMGSFRSGVVAHQPMAVGATHFLRPMTGASADVEFPGVRFSNV